MCMVVLVVFTMGIQRINDEVLFFGITCNRSIPTGTLNIWVYNLVEDNWEYKYPLNLDLVKSIDLLRRPNTVRHNDDIYLWTKEDFLKFNYGQIRTNF